MPALGVDNTCQLTGVINRVTEKLRGIAQVGLKPTSLFNMALHCNMHQAKHWLPSTMQVIPRLLLGHVQQGFILSVQR